jgi:hypothetical protein
LNALQESYELLKDTNNPKIDRVREIIDDLYKSRTAWIEAALAWSESPRYTLPGGEPISPESVDRAVAFEFLTLLKSRNGDMTTSSLVDDVAEKLHVVTRARVRASGNFWAFHLSFIRAAIEEGRPKAFVIEKIEDLSEAMSGDRRP